MAKKKRRVKVGLGFKLFYIVLFIISILLLIEILYLNVLSNLLLGIVLGGIFLVNLICFFLLMRSKKKKLGLVVSSLFIVLFSLVWFYLGKTTEFFSNINIDYKTYNYSVIVLNDAEYQKLNDIEGKKLGYYDEESEENLKAVDKIKKKVDVEWSANSDIHGLMDDLVNNEVDALLVEQSVLDILNENIINDNIAFKDMVREIYSFTIRVIIDDVGRDLNVTKEPFSIYISGIDTYGEISSVSRSDVNMVATVNPSTRQILLTSIPRDYYVDLYGKTGYKDKITHAGLYGIETSIKTIENLLDTEINYYVKVNFSSVIDIVNAIGGVSVYSEYEFTSIDNYHYEKGYNELNGEEALSFARERKAFSTGDRQRVLNQQALLEAILDKCMSKSIITKYSELLDSFSNSFVTNMKMSRITSLIKLQISKNYSWNIVSNSLNGVDASNYTYSAPNSKVYVMESVDESVDYAISLIDKVMNGELLDKEAIESELSNITTIVNSKSSSISTNSTNETTIDDKEESYENTKEDSTNAKLVAKLVKSSITIPYGDEYIYHGVIATYGGVDITNSNKFSIKFKIQNKSYDDYRDLIYYISTLDSGNYVINYIASYDNESIVLNQSVTILEKTTTDIDDEMDVNTKDDTIENNDSITDDDINNDFANTTE